MVATFDHYLAAESLPQSLKNGGVHYRYVHIFARDVFGVASSEQQQDSSTIEQRANFKSTIGYRILDVHKRSSAQLHTVQGIVRPTGQTRQSPS